MHHHHVVVDIGAGAMLGHHRDSRRAFSSAGVPPPDSTGSGMPAALNSATARVKNSQRARRVVREDQQPFEARGRAACRRAGRDRAPPPGVCTPLRPKPPSHSISTGTLAAAAARRVGEAAQHGLVVGDDGEPPDALGKVHQPAGLGRADDVEGDQQVVGDAGIDEDLGLAELLAGEARRARLDLHLADRRDLVRLDVRAVAPARGRDHALARARCCAPAGRAGSSPQACRDRPPHGRVFVSRPCLSRLPDRRKSPALSCRYGSQRLRVATFQTWSYGLRRYTMRRRLAFRSTSRRFYYHFI